MNASKGDYLLVKEGEKAKPYLIKFTKVSDGSVVGTREEDRHIDPQVVEVSPKHVLINLGDDPKVKKVDGVTISDRFVTSVVHPVWGDVHVLTKVSKEDRDLLKASLDRTARKVEKLGLAHLIEGTITEVRSKQGKWAGKYKHGHGDDPARMIYAPEWADGSAKAMDYVVLHEFGHRVRYAGVKSPKIRARWLHYYNRSISRTVVTTDDIKEIMKGLANPDGETSLNQTLKEIAAENDERTPQLKTLARWFKQVRHLSFRDLGVIWEAGEMDAFNALWPDSDVDSSELAPIVSEYATKNVEELFAESFAYHCTAQKLPSKISDLLEKTLERVEVAEKKSKKEEPEEAEE